ncbi:MAG TPA: hypothetical protein DHW02_11945, partial [Ktedonobacter sp.]|nr:hypothetical protein [Ktedonobacter sp.]
MSDFTPDTDELVSDTTPMIPASDEHSSEYSDVQETPQTITNANDILHAIDNHADIPDREAAREPVTSPGTVEHEDNEEDEGDEENKEGEKPHEAQELQTELALPITPLPSIEPVAPEKSRQKRKPLALALLIVLLVGVLTPLVAGAIYGIEGYSTYRLLKNDATNGVQHLLNIKNLLSSKSNTKSSSSTATTSVTAKLMNARTLADIRSELSAAHEDFTQVNSLIDHSSIIHMVTQYSGKYRVEVQSARAASQIGVDVTDMGQILLSTAQVLLPKLQGPLLDTSNKPLVTSSDLTLIGNTIDEMLPYINDIEQQSHHMSLDSLPLSVHEREQLSQYLPLVPQLQAALIQGKSLMSAVGWMLGVNSPRTFLVQTMDRAELRATGGFTGQYGELHVSGGRVAPFSLRDISLIEYANNSPTTNNLPPLTYRSWWPFANWGLRDSNLSADFPTSAQISIQQYKQETHTQVDGVILFTPFLIEQVLQVTGPIYIPLYKETITAQNMESRLHYYQLDNAGIKKQIELQGKDTSTSQRKAFTSLVAHTLMDTLRHASVTTLLALGRQMVHALQTKDLQVYFANSQLEALLVKYNDAAQINTSMAHDGLYVVQTNVSASKASQYVRTVLHDTVTLNSNGGATHVMQIRLEYNELGFVYGYDTYRDYVRVYVPPTSKLLWGNGFDTGQPLCGGYYSTCPQQNVYKGRELVCPSGLYEPGAAAPSPIDPNGANYLPLDKLGGPTNTSSDTPGRAMFAGYAVIPKNCTLTLTLSWYVPPMGHVPYDLLVQRQAGTFPELNLTILPTPENCGDLKTQGLYVDRVLGEDTSFALSVTTHAGKT